MDEKLQNILDRVREAAVVIGNGAADAACGVGARAAELLSVGKMNVRAAELETTILTELRHVGEMIYATHTGDPTDSEELLAKLQEIDELKTELARLKLQIARTKGLPVCDDCGCVGVKGDLFCRDCGRKI